MFWHVVHSIIGFLVLDLFAFAAARLDGTVSNFPHISNVALRFALHMQHHPARPDVSEDLEY